MDEFETRRVDYFQSQLEKSGRLQNVRYMTEGSFGLIFTAYQPYIGNLAPSVHLVDVADKTNNNHPANVAIKVENDRHHSNTRLLLEYEIINELWRLHNPQTPVPPSNSNVTTDVARRYGSRTTMGRGLTSLSDYMQLSKEYLENPVITHNEHTSYRTSSRRATLRGFSFPQAYEVGRMDANWFMIMDLLGDNLATKFKRCSYKFSIKTIVMLAIKLTERLRELHSINYIHRDVKPENILLGAANQGKAELFFIDFGLSCLYVDPDTNRPYPSNADGTVGTIRYASLNTMHKRRQSRRDDFISLTYMLAMFSLGSLPWQNLKLPSQRIARASAIRRKAVMKVKSSIPLSDLYNSLPVELGRFFRDVHGLGFYAAPPYIEYLQWFREYFNRTGEQCDWVYDWDKIRET